MQKWIILIVISVVLIIGTIIVLNIDIETEYVPETEVSESALRKTIVTLFFKDKESENIIKESRLIDSKKLLQDPYQELVKMLIEGPENQNFEKLIPEGTKILETTYESGCVTINFSKEFVNSEENNNEQLISSIFNTLKELTEVNTIKILIEGEENEKFNNIILDMQKERNEQENINTTINSNLQNISVDNTLLESKIINQNTISN